MKIAVVGTGYVGLVSGTCLAETGNYVTCVDIDENKVKKLTNGKMTIYEPGLETLFERNIKHDRLKFTTDLESGVKDAEVIFLALPTPPGEDGSADLSYILGVANELGGILKDYKVIVDKSTVPVGTSEKVRAAISKKYKGDFDVVSNPEFLREGAAVEDFMKPDRVVIGCGSERGRKVMNKLYAPYVRQGNPIIFMDERSAELTKYAANSFLATKITFMNEIANLCEKTGADVDLIRKGIGSDFRIGKHFLYAGCGYGGSCFPKDVQALEQTSKDYDYEFKIINSVIEVNEYQKLIMIRKIKEHYNNELSGKKVAIWGLAFKPNTDDIREAPALYVINELLDAGAEVSVYDPEAIENVRSIFGERIHYADDQYGVLPGSDFLLILTEWAAFRTPDFKKIRELLKSPVIFDGRNIFTLEQMTELGFYYNSIGRKTIGVNKEVLNGNI